MQRDILKRGDNPLVHIIVKQNMHFKEQKYTQTVALVSIRSCFDE